MNGERCQVSAPRGATSPFASHESTRSRAKVAEARSRLCRVCALAHTAERTSRARAALPVERRAPPTGEGRARVLPKTSRMYTLGLDTIAGSKLLQVKFGSAGAFQPDQAVLHEERRARFIRISDGAAIIRHWGDSQPVAVPPEALSLPPASQNVPPRRTPVVAGARAETGRIRRRYPQRRRVVLP